MLLRRDGDPAGEDKLLAEQTVRGVALNPSFQSLCGLF
jgi:hypothetical protein